MFLFVCQQELELQVVREVLEVFVRVCIFLDQPMLLSFVFKAISSRLDYVSSARVVPLHKMYLFYVSLPVNTVASWLVRSSPDQAVWVRGLTENIALCFRARQFTVTVPLSTQVYKWVPATLIFKQPRSQGLFPGLGAGREKPAKRPWERG